MHRRQFGGVKHDALALEHMKPIVAFIPQPQLCYQSYLDQLSQNSANTDKHTCMVLLSFNSFHI